MIKKNNYLTAKEHEIMKVLWNSDKPLIISEILEMTQNVAENSFHPMISNLIKKGYIKVVGNMKVVKTLSRLYAPAISIDEYAAIQLNDVFNSTTKNCSLLNVMSYFAKYTQKKNDEEIINELTQFIDEYKESVTEK